MSRSLKVHLAVHGMFEPPTNLQDRGVLSTVSRTYTRRRASWGKRTGIESYLHVSGGRGKVRTCWFHTEEILGEADRG